MENAPLVVETVERWRPVRRWEDQFEVSDYGHVRRKGPVPQDVGWVDSAGYVVVEFTERIRVSRLVYETFVGALPPDHDCHHKDNHRTNNHVSNLECVSHVQHGHYSALVGQRRLTDQEVRYIRTRELAQGRQLKTGPTRQTVQTLAVEFNTSTQVIRQIRKRKLYDHVSDEE